MALSEEQKKKIEEEEKVRYEIRSELSQKEKSNQKYEVAAVLSLFIPGLGQLVKGQTGRGILIFFATIVGYAFFVIPGLIIHIWQIVDAYNK